jgi:nitrogen regulatory protein P-II 1
MKRIEATIQATKIAAVTEAINDIVGGFTILEGKGRGSGIRQQIRSGRGTGSITAEYNEVATVSTVVNDSDVEKISTAIANAAYTGKGGDGIIIVSSVENVLNIASKKSGSEALSLFSFIHILHKIDKLELNY